MPIFKIQCIVTPRKLAEALNSLSDLSIEPPVVTTMQPQFGSVPPSETVSFKGTKTKGKKWKKKKVSLKASTNGRGQTVELLKQFILQKKEPVKAKDLQMSLVDKGYHKSAYSYALGVLIDQGIVSKVPGQSGLYQAKG